MVSFFVSEYLELIIVCRMEEFLGVPKSEYPELTKRK